MFNGPWKIIDKDSLEARPRPEVGEIIRHRSGAVILCCPKCNALQFAHSPIVGSDELPTLTKRIKCGAGHCDRCGVIFSVDTGKTVMHEEEEPKPAERPIPKKLRDAGVKPPPKLPPELR